MVTEIWVEGHKLDLNGDVDTLLNFNIDDIKDFSSRNTSYSKTIVIPGTQNNNKLFNDIYDISKVTYYNSAIDNINLNFNTNASAKCLIFQNNIQIFKGTLKVLQVVIDKGLIEYECAVFGELGNLIYQMGTHKLEELNFSLYNHEYNLTNITDSWSNYYVAVNGIIGYTFYSIDNTLTLFGHGYNINDGDDITISNTTSNNTTYHVNTAVETTMSFGGGIIDVTIYTLSTTPVDESSTIDRITIKKIEAGYGYYYPLIDYGTYSTNKIDWDIKTFRPALFVKEYIQKMFKFLNYQLECSFFNLDFFKRLIIPYNNKLLNTYKLTQFGIRSQYGNGCIPLTFPRTLHIGISNNIYDLGSFTTSDNITYTWTGANTALIYNYSGNFIFNFNFSNSIRFSGILYFYKISGGVETVIAQSNYFNLWDYGSNQYITTLSFNASFSINNGDEIRLDIYVSGDRFTLSGGFEQLCINFTQTNINQINSTTPLLTPIAYNDIVTINDSIPKNILFKDFVSSLMKMFNLYLYEDSIQNKIIIKPYIDYYDKDVTHAKDWTNKLDMSKPITIKPMAELNAKVYKFQYKKDSDFYNDQYNKRYNQSYGSFRFDTEQEFSEDEKNIDIIFSGTPLIGYDTGGKVYPTIFKRSGIVEETIDSNIRILQTKKINCDGYNIYYNDGSPQTYNSSIYGYAGHFDNPYAPVVDINFGLPYELYYTPTDLTNTVNLFSLYWIAYMYEIIDVDSRLLIGTFRLNEVDMLQLDFSKFIYINGTLFRLNKIQDYDAINRNTCKVELLKVINVEY